MIAFVGPHPLAIVARAKAVFGVLQRARYHVMLFPLSLGTCVLTVTIL